MKSFGACQGAAAIILWASSTAGFAADWPRLVQAGPAECKQALRLAQAAFKAPSASLQAPFEPAAGFPSQRVIHPTGREGDALVADPDVFENLVGEGDHPILGIHRQKAAHHGRHLVVTEEVHSWRGNVYAVWVVDPHTGRDALLAALKADKVPSGAQAVELSGQWQPPWVFMDKRTGALWMIDTGQPYSILDDWRVHVMTSQGSWRRCEIGFRPDVDRVERLLPEPVQKWIRLLDQTMGRGENEGTLNPTARLRLSAQHTAANAAMRPWAQATAYNTREEVAEGLAKWAQAGPSYRQHREAIERQYAVAQPALVSYYKQRFGRSASQAKALATYWLDATMRAHYTFHSDTPHTDDAPNPWSASK